MDKVFVVIVDWWEIRAAGLDVLQDCLTRFDGMRDDPLNVLQRSGFSRNAVATAETISNSVELSCLSNFDEDEDEDEDDDRERSLKRTLSTELTRRFGFKKAGGRIDIYNTKSACKVAGVEKQTPSQCVSHGPYIFQTRHSAIMLLLFNVPHIFSPRFHFFLKVALGNEVDGILVVVKDGILEAENDSNSYWSKVRTLRNDGATYFRLLELPKFKAKLANLSAIRRQEVEKALQGLFAYEASRHALEVFRDPTPIYSDALTKDELLPREKGRKLMYWVFAAFGEDVETSVPVRSVHFPELDFEAKAVSNTSSEGVEIVASSLLPVILLKSEFDVIEEIAELGRECSNMVATLPVAQLPKRSSRPLESKIAGICARTQHLLDCAKESLRSRSVLASCQKLESLISSDKMMVSALEFQSSFDVTVNCSHSLQAADSCLPRNRFAVRVSTIKRDPTAEQRLKRLAFPDCIAMECRSDDADMCDLTGSQPMKIDNSDILEDSLFS